MLKKYIKIKTILVLFILTLNTLEAKPSTAIDSLKILLDSTAKSNSQIILLNQLSNQYIEENSELAFLYGKKALKLSIELGNDKKTAECYFNLGMLGFDFDNYNYALANFNKSLKIREALNLKKEVIDCYDYIGVTYRNKGDYLNATENTLKAIKINDDVGDQLTKARLNGNLAIIFNLRGKSEDALMSFLESLKIFQKLGTPSQVSASLSNIGNVYLSQNKLNQAIDYYLRSLAIMEDLNKEREIALIQGNIAVAYHNQKKYTKSLEYLNFSLIKYKKLGTRREISRTFNNIGSVYLEQKKFSSASSYFKKSLEIASTIDAKELVVAGYQNYSELYSNTGDYENALKYYQMFIEVKDSIQNDKISSQIAGIQAQFKLEKKEKKIILLEKEKIERKYQLKKRTILIYLVLISILVLAATFILFIKHSKTKRATLKYKQDQLKEKLKFKEREITSTVTYIANKNAVLSETKDELKEILTQLSGNEANYRIKSLINKLDDSLNLFEDWKSFRKNFDEIYPSFIPNLLKEHAQISHTDLKLCVYLKMGVSNKEIAKLQNVTLNGVKSANLRLKKKMNISANISLSTFISRL